MNRLVTSLVLALTAGLAPFAPEPHVVGKIRWVLGGADGMAALDWLDLAFHGAPWLWLSYELARAVSAKLRRPAEPPTS
jgi:hypothetical protein